MDFRQPDWAAGIFLCWGRFCRGGRWRREQAPALRGIMGGAGVPSSAPVCALGHLPRGKALREIATPVCELARNDRGKPVAGCVEFGAVGGRRLREGR